jgi:hypothetical protein
MRISGMINHVKNAQESGQVADIGMLYEVALSNKVL